MYLSVNVRYSSTFSITSADCFWSPHKHEYDVTTVLLSHRTLPVMLDVNSGELLRYFNDPPLTLDACQRELD